MADYDEMKDPGQRNYMPYLMYFHRPDFVSRAVNTDRSGFRISSGAGEIKASAAGHLPPGPVRILAGGSTALGVGASSDANTLASLLWRRYALSTPWLNFGGYCYNPLQEALLFTLYRHLLGAVDEVVICSGINAVMVSRFPRWQQGDHGAFFFCGEYLEQMEELRHRSRRKSRLFGGGPGRRSGAIIATIDDVRRDVPVVIASAVEMTLRQLDIWRRMAGPQTRISYCLQPMALWMGRTGAPQERLLFDENDRASELGPWEEVYGDIATPDFKDVYAEALRLGCEELGVRFVDLNPVVAEATTGNEWMFVDRVHYNDAGHDIVARLMAQELQLS